MTGLAFPGSVGRAAPAPTADRAGRCCDNPVFTGFTRDGGFASHCLADARFCLHLPGSFADVEAAPLLCAGLIGYRSLNAADEGSPLGLYGFGAAAHIIAQVAAFEGRQVFAFTREGDEGGQAFARSLGCAWVGSSDRAPPEPMAAAIIFAPVGALVPQALRHVLKGGRIVCAGIHMSDIPAFPYELLWGERAIVSVANLTRADGRAFLTLAERIALRTATTPFPLAEANAALDRLRARTIRARRSSSRKFIHDRMTHGLRRHKRYARLGAVYRLLGSWPVIYRASMNPPHGIVCHASRLLC